MKKFLVGLAISMAIGGLTGFLTNGQNGFPNTTHHQTVLAASKKTDPNQTSKKNKSETKTNPSWLIEDLKLASEVQFPMKADRYGLNWDAEAYANGPKPFNVYADTKNLWIGGYMGTTDEQNYVFYAGPYDIKSLYDQAKKGTDVINTQFIYMLEKGPKQGDPGHLTPAESLNLGNGEFLAFANDEIITKSVHAGMDEYEVYQVPGIQIPNSQ